MNDPRRISVKLRALVLVALAVATAVVLFSRPAFPQDCSYHDFADQRILLSVPHCLNVISNVPFLVVGMLGLRFLSSEKVRKPTFLEPAERRAFLLFFLGVGLTGLGSSYYHLEPTNDRLLWDRLPMALAFMALFAALLGERIDPKAASWLLPPLVLAGFGSVLYWHWSETLEAGDLRFYYLVQLYPLLAIPLVLLFFPPRFTRAADWLVVVGLYVLAKIVEHRDAEIYSFGSIVSGHTLKHLTAALAAYWILLMLRKGTPAVSSGVRGQP